MSPCLESTFGVGIGALDHPMIPGCIQLSLRVRRVKCKGHICILQGCDDHWDFSFMYSPSSLNGGQIQMWVSFNKIVDKTCRVNFPSINYSQMDWKFIVELFAPGAHDHKNKDLLAGQTAAGWGSSRKNQSCIQICNLPQLIWSTAALE